MFTRVAIINRGEAAMRFIHAARELRVGEQAIRTIALYSAVEPQAMFVREADEAIEISSSVSNPYLDHDELIRAIRAARADAVWVGWGFVAEDPVFASRCADIGVTFIGPSAEVMRALGDKIGAKQLAESVGVPVAAWSGGSVETVAEAQQIAERIGFPLMVKATAGGGGRGIRRVEDPADLEVAFDQARNEVASSFGDPTVFLERVVSGARHVEVQILADNYGNVWTPGVRDCSVQRRNQKVLEESASTVLPAAFADEARAAAVRLALAAGYRGAGTVEFLYQPEEQLLAFLEVNTRLQVEHPVTEITTGIDLVKLQLFVASGGRLEGEPPTPRGHAIEVRLNAEDPDAGFAPAPGVVEHVIWPSGPGIRVDTGYASGDVVPLEFDSMMAKIIAWGADREEARTRLERALLDTTVLVNGGTTNKAFLTALINQPDVINGVLDTRWLDRLAASGVPLAKGRSDVALIACAIAAADAIAAGERERFFAAAARGRAQGSNEAEFTADLQHQGRSYRVEVSRLSADEYRVTTGEQAVEVHVESLGRFERRLSVGDQRFRVVSLIYGGNRDRRGANEDLVEIDGVPHRVTRDSAGIVRALAPGVIVALRVEAGDMVEADQPVAVVESMKMEVTIRSGVAGRVGEVLVNENVRVETGTPLVRIEMVAEQQASSDDETVSFAELVRANAEPNDATERCRRTLEGMLNLVLGFDYSPEDAEHLVEEYDKDRRNVGPSIGSIIDAELGILTTFADLCSLNTDRRSEEESETGSFHSARGSFISYLQTLDAERSGLTANFVVRLGRALAHYGVVDLDPSPELEESLHRIFLANQRLANQLPAVMAILEYHLQWSDIPSPSDVPDSSDVVASEREHFLDALERLIAATQLRLPVLRDLAQSVRFALFDEPLIEARLDLVMSTMWSHLSRAAATTNAAQRERLLGLLVEGSHPLIELLVELDDEKRQERELLVEVMTRRYYDIVDASSVRHIEVEGQRGVVVDYQSGGAPVAVVAIDAHAEFLLGDDGRDGLTELLDGVEGPAILELFVHFGERSLDPDEIATELGEALNRYPVPPELARVTLSATSHAGDDEEGDGTVHRLTWRPEAEAPGAPVRLVEDRALRDLHPMISERLDLWRLVNFDLTRLPSAGQVYLYRCVAREVPTDVRLVALAEVRDLTPLRNRAGQVAALPELEHVLAGCLDAIRRARAESPGARAQWNRVVLSGWQRVIEIPLEELVSVLRSLAPMTVGLDLEQVTFQFRVAEDDGSIRSVVVRIVQAPGAGPSVRVSEPPTTPMLPIDAYAQKVLQARRRGAVYPYEIVHMLTSTLVDPTAGSGSFVEYDLDGAGKLVPIDRPYGLNSAAMVVGVVSTPTARYPEGMRRVVLLGDPTKGLGSLAEPECRRVCEALDLAEELGVPLEWFTVSSGARIAMHSGTENLDWTAQALRRIVTFTQAGGEINIMVTGINVGAQAYWNAEATMLMHTKGILVMTPDSAMVLTGKQALEYSGGVAAEDNFGIGGYDTVMGPNGEGQYWAPDLAAAIQILLLHYSYSYVAPGERFARAASTLDPIDRDVQPYPHPEEDGGFSSVGDIFSGSSNPDRKRPFDIRAVMRAVIDQDCTPLERWPEMRDAETAVVYDALLGGRAVTVLGIESEALVRRGVLPADGPSQWTAGTLFPRSSKKLARAINAASGNRPVVVLANLSGFDGSPESLRNLQLEYGAEIARAVVNFDGPIVFCLISRYHGGAFVVFSASLNDKMEVVAVEGSFASVIGGAPAAAVVFTAEVNSRTESDPRMTELQRALAVATGPRAVELRARLEVVRESVRAEKLGEVADEFEAIHTIERAREVGSIHEIIRAGELRPFLVDAVQRGITRAERRS